MPHDRRHCGHTHACRWRSRLRLPPHAPRRGDTLLDERARHHRAVVTVFPKLRRGLDHHGNPPTPTEATPTAPACEDGSPTPIGTCLHPASVQWLPDLLPDPREVNRTNPEEVAIAYVITRNVWDASRDRTNAYASIRASVYETPARANNHTPTPDLERGQGEFLPLLANQVHTSVTITDTNTNAPQPNTDTNRWLGNV